MSRKLLVPADPTNPDKKINDFLFPEPIDGTFKLKGIRKGKNWELGMVVLTSETSKEDIFKDIVVHKHKISDVDNLMKTLGQYQSTLQNFKIGNILKIDTGTSELSFLLEYKSPGGMKRAMQSPKEND